jgi:hypothetical protein
LNFSFSHSIWLLRKSCFWLLDFSKAPANVKDLGLGDDWLGVPWEDLCHDPWLGNDRQQEALASKAPGAVVSSWAVFWAGGFFDLGLL